MSGQMTTSEARAVDPILSGYARGYSHPEAIHTFLFPNVVVPVRGARVLRFGKESFRLYNGARAPGANTLRIQYGFATDPISLLQFALEGLVPFELLDEALAVPGIDLGQGAVQMVLDNIQMQAEKTAADLAQDANNYNPTNKVTLAGADKWSDAGSDPLVQILDYKEAIRLRTGRNPNVLVLGAQVLPVLQTHPKILDHFKYTSADSVTVDMLARYFQIARVVVGNAVYADDDDDFVDLWGNVAILAFVPPGSNWQVPSYGYTYYLPTAPYVEMPYFERNPKSWIYPVTDERRPYLTGMDAGYLIQAPK